MPVLGAVCVRSRGAGQRLRLRGVEDARIDFQIGELLFGDHHSLGHAWNLSQAHGQIFRLCSLVVRNRHQRDGGAWKAHLGDNVDVLHAGFAGTEGSITVNPAAASKFLISASASVSAGTAFSLTLEVEDAYGNIVTNYTGTVHFSSTDSKATLPANYTFTGADKGVHSFTGLVLRKKGNQSITISDTHNRSLTGSVLVDVT